MIQQEMAVASAQSRVKSEENHNTKLNEFISDLEKEVISLQKQGKDLAQDLEAEGRGHATALINAGRETQLLEEKFTLQINSLRDEMKSLQANGSMMRVSNQVRGGTGGHGGANIESERGRVCSVCA